MVAEFHKTTPQPALTTATLLTANNNFLKNRADDCCSFRLLNNN